ncbi:MAG: hypothetical protein CM15mP68_0400 [Pseudomonadota bacterium]|nr:MAG: hypothetical protein CM15mP68_0400 [Pseudomonadota bacterium]
MRCMPTTHATKCVYKALVAHVVSGSRAAHHSVAKAEAIFADNGVGFAYEDTSQGRLNTVWLALDADQYRDIVRASLGEAKQEDALSAGKDRLLIRVEKGPAANRY